MDYELRLMHYNGETEVEVGDVLMSILCLVGKPMIGIPALFYGGKAFINNAS